MDTQDIKTFIRAKKQDKRQFVTLLVVSIFLIAYVLLNIFGTEFYPRFLDTSIIMLSVIFVFMLFRQSSQIVSQNELLDIIERSINNDPDALKLLIQSQKE